ncbi:MAG: isoleucine--tRNA ligase [Chloroflexi bacterium]|nr:isoleucine--tRNA ligase [Chloroflexota bacterium]
MYQPVGAAVDLPALEQRIQAWWDEQGVMARYLRRNERAAERYSFIDGPITANGLMGVHHAWGRTYKDLFQRYQTMLGKRQRYQNGFDCQGLWVEVEVEKELGLTSKRDIETYGIAAFVERCKERVVKFSGIQTAQSIRLGYWMDWDDSYYTMSDENNYTIWQFLKSCHERGWIYKGHDVMPWCPRCATGISNMEIVTEGYQERTHTSVYVRFPLHDRPGEYLLAWTTTPWTLAANVAAAVHPDLTYVKVRDDTGVYYLAKGCLGRAISRRHEVLAELPGRDLIGWRYDGPFDDLPAAAGVEHRVIAWDEVSETEGAGIVHIAPGCGQEDFALSKEHGLAVIAPIDEAGLYVDGYAWLTGQYVEDTAWPIVENLREKDLLYRAEPYTHRYPVCWRCGTDLIFRLVDEWFISMDGLREPLMRVTREITWVPEFGLERELDWLRNMDDWMISKKRYWGLALPIYECTACGHFDVIGSEVELRERAIAGWDEFAGHTPHRPWVDAVKIACGQCGAPVSRIADVGNPWLDAGIVAMSTLGYRHDRAYWEEWFPADLISESFPGQFRNWFYSLLTMSTGLEDRAPTRAVFSYALMRDETGREMHKSWGNAIPFDEAADRVGADAMRWLFVNHNPAVNLNFGYGPLGEVMRQFVLTLWNSYSFFVTYARLEGFDPTRARVPLAERALLDRWLVARLHQTTGEVRAGLEGYDPPRAGRAIAAFVDDLSNWYIRRNRRRFWKTDPGVDDSAAAFLTLWECLVGMTTLLAPIMPFLTEELYQNLVRSVDQDAPLSVHLCDFPAVDPAAVDTGLLADMAAVQTVVSLGRAARSKAGVKVRQPLARALVKVRARDEEGAIARLREQVLDELNVKDVTVVQRADDLVFYGIRPNLPLLGPKYGKRLGAIRQALAQVDPAAVAHAVSEGRATPLAVAGATIELAPDEVLVDMQPRPGFAAVEQDGYLVGLDAALTPDLVAEGLARDLIRAINDARKEAGLNVEDQIALWVDGDAALQAALAEWHDVIRREVLATTLTHSPAPAGATTATADVGETTVGLGLVRET